MSDETTAMVRQQGSAIVRAAGSEDLMVAIEEYKRVQGALDRALPDCIMRIKGNPFRKKAYWRGVATAFNLDVELVSEELLGGDDWGYSVLMRASAPNGRCAVGDGACTRSEKDDAMATLHNVRAHAHTRAYNRAVSNLVGFGEVSADELGRDAYNDEPRRNNGGQQQPPQSDWNEKGHHKSYTDVEQRRFSAVLGVMGLKYVNVAARCERDSKGRPSGWFQKDRKLFETMLADGRLPQFFPTEGEE